MEKLAEERISLYDTIAKYVPPELINVDQMIGLNLIGLIIKPPDISVNYSPQAHIISFISSGTKVVLTRGTMGFAYIQGNMYVWDQDKRRWEYFMNNY